MNNGATKRAPTPQPQPLTTPDVRHFLGGYKKAWETQDPDLAASLFTRDAEYKQDPFSSPIVGREAIHDYWASATSRQEGIHFTLGTVLQCGYLLAAEWTCRYRDRSTGETQELTAMFLADFYGK